MVLTSFVQIQNEKRRKIIKYIKANPNDLNYLKKLPLFFKYDKKLFLFLITVNDRYFKYYGSNFLKTNIHFLKRAYKINSSIIECLCDDRIRIQLQEIIYINIMNIMNN